MEQQETKDSLDILIVGCNDKYKNNYMKLLLANSVDNLVIYKDIKFYLFGISCNELQNNPIDKFDYYLFVSSVIVEIPDE